jgi:hypothetical protein
VARCDASEWRREMVKIVTYNVNGLRPRVVQHGSLRRLLDALDADIICFQVRPIADSILTKLSCGTLALACLCLSLTVRPQFRR